MPIEKNKFYKLVTEKTVIHRRSDEETAFQTPDELSMATSCFARRPLSGTVSVSQSAYLEIFGVQRSSFGHELDAHETSIGRSPDCRIHLPLAGVSRRHARITFQNEEYYVEDLKSTNGTYVNTVKIVKCVLRNNDQIEIGEVKIIFVEEKSRQMLSS